MTRRRNQLSVYVPDSKKDKNLIGRLEKIAEKRDRSVNYLIIRAISEYLEKEEDK